MRPLSFMTREYLIDRDDRIKVTTCDLIGQALVADDAADSRCTRIIPIDTDTSFLLQRRLQSSTGSGRLLWSRSDRRSGRPRLCSRGGVPTFLDGESIAILGIIGRWSFG